MDMMAYISSLRHARNVSVTALHALEKANETCPDRISEEGLKQSMQNIQKVITGITNELSRYNISLRR
jgi:hypothetical protein